MAVRKVINARQLKAAELIVGGMSQYQALRKAGYSHSVACHPERLRLNSWGLRQAIREEQDRLHIYLTRDVAPKRRYNRRAVARSVGRYCVPEDREQNSNTFVRQLKQSWDAAERAEKELSPKPVLPAAREYQDRRCRQCGGETEGPYLWCVRYQISNKPVENPCPQCGGPSSRKGWLCGNCLNYLEAQGGYGNYEW